MSNILGNPHYTISEGMMVVADDYPMPDSDRQAQVATLAALQQATQALVYEQRTANLIAAFNASVAADGETETFIGERIDTYELSKQISTRLGNDQL